MTSGVDWLPFAGLNLLRNPFGELTREERMRAAVVDVDRWRAMLKSNACGLQFMGDCGRGKTTHLLALRQHFPDAAYVYLPQDEPLPPIPEGRPLFIDEAQRLPWLVRRKVFRSDVPLVLGTHVDFGGPLRGSGRRVETIQVAEQMTPNRLIEILNRRVALARLDTGRVPTLTAPDVDYLIRRFGDDVRSIEDYLYDCFEKLKGAANGELRIVDRAG